MAGYNTTISNIGGDMTGDDHLADIVENDFASPQNRKKDELDSSQIFMNNDNKKQTKKS